MASLSQLSVHQAVGKEISASEIENACRKCMRVEVSNTQTLAFDELTIEHIMPQTLTAKWKIDLGKKATEIYEKYVHCIGNLTLTGYNSEMSNDSFEE